MNKLLVVLVCALLFLVFHNFKPIDKGYSTDELRDLYGSGNQKLWPKPHLFDEAK